MHARENKPPPHFELTDPFGQIKLTLFVGKNHETRQNGFRVVGLK